MSIFDLIRRGGMSRGSLSGGRRSVESINNELSSSQSKRRRSQVIEDSETQEIPHQIPIPEETPEELEARKNAENHYRRLSREFLEIRTKYRREVSRRDLEVTLYKASIRLKELQEEQKDFSKNLIAKIWNKKALKTID